MNKTVTINLSGIVFHIEEHAFETLRKYLDTLKSHFAGTPGRDEIVADIESRMAEMFSEKVSPSKNVIVDADVDEVIAKMGKPEDLGGEETVSSDQPSADPYQYGRVRRRLYRSPDDRWLGGVCGGIASYFDIDPLWLRLAFVLLVFLGVGSGILLYIILWIIIPVAKTPSEKLQMRGEPVNVASIKKSVEEEIESIKKRGEYDPADNAGPNYQRRSASSKFGDFLVDVLRAFAKFIIVIIGVFLTIISLIVLFALSVAVFSVGAVKVAIPHVLTNMVLTDSQTGWLIAGIVLAIGIPFTLLLLYGLKVLFRIKLNLRPIGAVLAVICLIGIGICIYEGVAIGSEFQHSTTVTQSSLIVIPQKNIMLKASSADNLKDINGVHFDVSSDMRLNESEDSIYGKMDQIDIVPSDNDSVYVVKKLSSCGSSYEEAKQMALKTNYTFKQNDSMLLFPQYFGLSIHDKFRGQHASVSIHIPVGRTVFIDHSLEDMLGNVQTKDDIDKDDLPGQRWMMTEDGLESLNSEKPEQPEKPEKENDGIHIQGKHGRIDIDSTGVNIQKTSLI